MIRPDQLQRLLDLNDVSNAEAAPIYAELDIAIFPLLPGRKEPHVRHGLLAASTNVELIKDWWASHPDSGIGATTGGTLGDVLDVDVKHGAPGLASFLRLRAAGLAVGSHAVATTASGGLHAVWAPSGLRNTTRPRIGLDVRGDGGYIVAAPSVIDGRFYRWERVEPERFGAPLPWRQICDLLDPVPDARWGADGADGDVGALIEWLADQEPGNRNASLFWAACRAVEAGENPEQLRPAALGIGLSEGEISRTLSSARNRVGCAA